MVDVGRIMAYEDGQLTKEQVLALFQEMIDDGSVWHLQGHYGRTAAALIEGGYCQRSEVAHKDAYGSIVPSRSDV